MPSRDTIVPGQTITVEGNKSVYAVAREHNVSMREIIVLNNLQPPFTLRPGQTLTLPANASGNFAGYNSSNEKGVAPAPYASPSPAIEQATPVAPAPAVPPQTAMAAPPLAATVPPTAPPPASSSSSPIDMRWPVQGPVLSTFGPKGQGLNNDGINIGAPKGAPVVAAANGIVVYAGNEMKGFGNLVLIRHKGGWVTAYAHLDRTLVNKDAVVAQGDMIGTVGKTGNVPSPQLHFETRLEGKPVDPATLIKAQ
jgi:murein DD-endopeptidase MepM/ murein hydrolase activator NlpD